jgi:hypothetical protein
VLEPHVLTNPQNTAKVVITLSGSPTNMVASLVRPTSLACLTALLFLLPLLSGCLQGGDGQTQSGDTDDLIAGCTDPFALNHEPSAELNDGSCQYEETSEPEDDGEPDAPQGNQTELEEQAQATVDLWEGENKILLILVHPVDSSPNLTTDEVESITADVGAWFEEVSYGRVWVNWTITGWYALDEAAHARQSVYQAVVADGYDITEYDRMVVGLQDYTARSSSTQGVQYYNVTTEDETIQILASRCDVKRFANTTSTRNTMSHELGHSFGLSHAEFDGSDSGEVDPYGNQYDTMGSSPLWRHFGAVYKHQLGWLDDQQVELVTTSGEYTLRPLEGESPHALRISMGIVEEEVNGHLISTEHFQYLEVREVLDIELSNKLGEQNMSTEALNGVIINHAAPQDQYGYHKWLARAQDATPETPSASSSDFLLLQGRTFSNSEVGIHITALNVTDNSTTVRIVLGEQLGNTPPVISDVVATAGNDGFLFSIEADDADGDELSIFWNFEVGMSAFYAPERFGSGTPVQHTFPDTEGMRVHVLVSDMRGGVATGWVDVWDYVNEAPIIEELTVMPVDEGIFEFRPIVTDQELLTYLWDFGDGNSSTFPQPVHEYAEAGIYSISLTISDGEFSTIATGSVDTQDSENVPPVANAGPDLTAAAGEIITLDGSQSTDPDSFPLPSMRYTWSSTANLDISDRSEAIATVVAPNEPGTYEIQLLVNDGDISVTDTMILTVTET